MYRSGKRLITALFLLFCATTHATESFRLSQFYAGDSTLRLQGASASETLSIPLASVKEIQSATVHIQGVSSSAMKKDRSILNVRFNNATISQIHLDPNSPYISQHIELPAELWRTGFNNLTFLVSQHFSDACEDGSSPELWSEVDLYRSSLTVQTTDGVDNLSLSDLAGFFSPGIGSQRNVSIATVSGDAVEVTTQVLPMIAQGLALRNDYQPLNFAVTNLDAPALPTLPDTLAWTDDMATQYTTSGWYLPAANTISQPISVLVATKEQLTPYISAAKLAKIDGPYLGVEEVRQFAVAATTLVPAVRRLIVSGNDWQDVLLAATTLAVMDDELNPDSDITIASQTPLTAKEYLNHTVIQPDRAYSFTEMKGRGTSFRGAGEYTHRVIAQLPADFYTPESAQAKILLDFAYGAELGVGSVMNVLINGKLVHGLPLNNPNGQAFSQYRLNVPARYFNGGINTIDFDVALRTPESSSNCFAMPDSHLIFQLHPSSSLALPEAGNVASQPDLALFSGTTYPFSAASAQKPGVVYYSQPAMLASALNMVGKLSQVEKTINPSLSVQPGVPDTPSPLAIVLATPADLNDELFEDYGVALTNSKKWSYRLQNAVHNEVRHTLSSSNSERDLIANATTIQRSSLGDLGVLLMKEDRTPRSAGSLMIIAAETPAILNQRIHDLVSLNLWGQLNGDFFVWNDDEKPLMAMRISPQYEVGEPTSKWLEYRMWLSNNPLYWVIAVLIVILLGTLLSYIALKRRNKDISSSW